MKEQEVHKFVMSGRVMAGKKLWANSQMSTMAFEGMAGPSEIYYTFFPTNDLFQIILDAKLT